MQSKNEMQRGWEFAIRIMGADIAAHIGQEYVNAVEETIKQLEENINDHRYRNLAIKQLQGYIFEEWAAGTFNVNAIAANSADHASVLHSTLKNSVDIELGSGKTYSAKSYATAEKTVKAQAKFNTESGQANYHNQERLVPSDQLFDAKTTAHREALRNNHVRPDISNAYVETESKLTDIIKNKDGVSSKSISRKELEDIASKSQKQEFNAKDHGLTANSTINMEHLLKQALKTGYTTAVITATFQLAPEIYKAVDFLIKHSEIDIQQIKRIGISGISANAEGFLRGSISSSILIMCEKGMLGEAFKNINPTVLGVLVAVVIQTVKNSILVASKKMNAQQMGAAFVDTIVISGGYLIGSHIGGIIGQTLGFELPVIGYLLGSLIGTSLCVVYNIGKKKLISFCVDTGFTCFGLVEQNYELPDEILNELGIKTTPILRTEIGKIALPKTEKTVTAIDRTEYETINITVLRRGIIGVNRVGYIK